MRCLRLTDLVPGMVLARPARALDGAPLITAGTTVTREHVQRLQQQGLQEVWVVPEGERVPDPTVPEYMDRYGADFASRLQGVFSKALVNRTMQHLFLVSLAHAADCYRRYRLDEVEE
jgi:hypothetical protein